MDGDCLLCSEDSPEFCHRRLVAEYLARLWDDIDINHIPAVKLQLPLSF